MHMVKKSHCSVHIPTKERGNKEGVPFKGAIILANFSITGTLPCGHSARETGKGSR